MLLTVTRDVEKQYKEKKITEEQAKERILPLALEYDLVTSFTSLLAIEEREEEIKGTMQTVFQPSESEPNEVKTVLISFLIFFLLIM